MFRLISKIVSLIGGVLLSVMAFAADIPQVDIDAQHFNQADCLDINYQQCLSGTCLTSDSTDCPEQCKKNALAVCQQKTDE